MSEPLRRARAYLKTGMENVKTAKAAGADMSVIVPLLTALVQLALEIVPGLLKRGELEEAIGEAAKELPKDWDLYVTVQNGVTEVFAHCPRGGQNVAPNKGTLADQVLSLIKLAKEREASHLP